MEIPGDFISFKLGMFEPNQMELAGQIFSLSLNSPSPIQVENGSKNAFDVLGCYYLFSC